MLCHLSYVGGLEPILSAPIDPPGAQAAHQGPRMLAQGVSVPAQDAGALKP